MIRDNRIEAGDSSANDSNGIQINGSSILINNSISGGGGQSSRGLYAQTGEPRLINNTIAAGDALDSYGVYVEQDSPIIINNTIIGGDGTSYGIYNNDVNSAISIAINNIITTSISGTGVYGSGAGDINYHYNCIYGNGGTDHTGITLGTGNVTVNPVLDTAGDYRLTASSPSTVTTGGVIDPFTLAGITPLDEYLLDIEGVTRTPAYVQGSTAVGWSMPRTSIDTSSPWPPSPPGEGGSKEEDSHGVTEDTEKDERI